MAHPSPIHWWKLISPWVVWAVKFGASSFRRRDMGTYYTLGSMEPVQVEQFFLGCLAHASYLVSSGGVAAVIDPQRDVDIYLEAAREKGLRIAHIVETHLHADFVS